MDLMKDYERMLEERIAYYERDAELGKKNLLFLLSVTEVH